MALQPTDTTDRDEIIRLLKGVTAATLLLILGALAVGVITGELQDIVSGKGINSK